MVFAIESIVACLLFTLMIKIVTWKRREAFTNDYHPVVTDKLRSLGLIAEKPPARKTFFASSLRLWFMPFFLPCCCDMSTALKRSLKVLLPHTVCGSLWTGMTFLWSIFCWLPSTSSTKRQALVRLTNRLYGFTSREACAAWCLA